MLMLCNKVILLGSSSAYSFGAYTQLATIGSQVVDHINSSLKNIKLLSSYMNAQTISTSLQGKRSVQSAYAVAAAAAAVTCNLSSCRTSVVKVTVHDVVTVRVSGHGDVLICMRTYIHVHMDMYKGYWLPGRVTRSKAEHGSYQVNFVRMLLL